MRAVMARDLNDIRTLPSPQPYVLEEALNVASKAQYGDVVRELYLYGGSYHQPIFDISEEYDNRWIEKYTRCHGTSYGLYSMAVEAIYMSDARLLDLAIRSGCDVNASSSLPCDKRKSEWPPAFFAAAADVGKSMVRQLLLAGADLDTQWNGYSCFDLAHFRAMTWRFDKVCGCLKGPKFVGDGPICHCCYPTTWF